ncbi:hypothetical protein LIER_19016 [Lithospermum erythrorhizon]|uniref:Uncharacterized protein n=1 Tax=Lithospermum erythrorhizon TaxID=34254 RepID=A0AAV3QIG1_LITER
MEQEATSQPGVTTRARSRAIPPTSRVSLPQDLPRPKPKEPDQTKDIGDQSPWVSHQNVSQEKFDESKDEAPRHSTSREPRKKQTHQLAPFAA